MTQPIKQHLAQAGVGLDTVAWQAGVSERLSRYLSGLGASRQAPAGAMGRGVWRHPGSPWVPAPQTLTQPRQIAEE